MKHFIISDGTQWPWPCGEIDVEWELRYGDPAKVRYMAATVVSAYVYLVQATCDKRALVARDIKAALKDLAAHAEAVK